MSTFGFFKCLKVIKAKTKDRLKPGKFLDMDNVKFTRVKINLNVEKLAMMHFHVDEANMRFITLERMKLITEILLRKNWQCDCKASNRF